jgi:hypothetical protein
MRMKLVLLCALICLCSIATLVLARVEEHASSQYSASSSSSSSSSYRAEQEEEQGYRRSRVDKEEHVRLEREHRRKERLRRIAEYGDGSNYRLPAAAQEHLDRVQSGDVDVEQLHREHNEVMHDRLAELRQRLDSGAHLAGAGRNHLETLRERMGDMNPKVEEMLSRHAARAEVAQRAREERQREREHLDTLGAKHRAKGWDEPDEAGKQWKERIERLRQAQDIGDGQQRAFP